MFFRKLRRRLMGNHRFRHRDGEHHLALNVPPSRKEVVMRRRRVMMRTLKWSAGAGLGLWAVIAAGDLWDRAFLTSTTYAVGQFELVTNGAITAPQVAAVTGLRPDQNITALDLGVLRRQLLTLPQVREAVVERRLPNHLSVRLEERRPAAWLACAAQGLRAFDSRGLLLDAEGVVFPAGVMLNEYTALPVIHCADLSAVTPGRQVEYPLIRQALQLVQLIGLQTWPQPMAVEQIHLTNRFTMVAQMDTDALFTFQPEKLERQLTRLHAILTKVGPSRNRVASVNLQLERNVPVTFFDPPPTALKAPSKPAPGAAPSRRAALPSRRTH
ncbi:MAG: FtsQ-type POTRA domain-containing protein [Verrucomicrobiota bacterium]